MRKNVFAVSSVVTAAAFLLAACGDKEEETPSVDGDVWASLSVVHRPSEDIVAAAFVRNNDAEATLDMRVEVTSAIKDPKAPAVRYTTEGDKDIERQIKDFLDPNGDVFTGTLPVAIEYRTEVCKNIRIGVYSKDSILLSDITDLARFYIPSSRFPEREKVEGASLLISSERKVLDWIEEGTTIKEYLSHDPMVFPKAYFHFPGIGKTLLESGNSVRIDIELGNGTVLTSLMQPVT